MQSPVYFFKLENDLEAWYIFFASVYLKYFLVAVVIVTVTTKPGQFTGDSQHSPIRRKKKRKGKKRKRNKKTTTTKATTTTKRNKTKQKPKKKHCRPAKLLTHENESRNSNINSQRMYLQICILLDGMTSGPRILKTESSEQNSRKNQTKSNLSGKA